MSSQLPAIFLHVKLVGLPCPAVGHASFGCCRGKGIAAGAIIVTIAGGLLLAFHYLQQF